MIEPERIGQIFGLQNRQYVMHTIISSSAKRRHELDVKDAMVMEARKQ
jgi:hypothetical protein